MNMHGFTGFVKAVSELFDIGYLSVEISSKIYYTIVT
jgi:hypothetical protein